MQAFQLSWRSLSKSGRAAALVAMLACAAPSGAFAAGATFPTVTTPVKLDGAVLGATAFSQFYNTIVHDSGTYYLWYVSDPDTFSLSSVKVATSADGISFTTQATLSPPAKWWADNGASEEPVANFVRVAKVGGDWMLMVWHPYDGTANSSRYGAYNYNTSVWKIGTNPLSTALTQIGPLSIPPGGQHAGPFGMVGSQIYITQDTPGAFGRYTLPSGAPLNTDPAALTDVADLYAGTGWCWFSGSGCNQSFVHNYGRTLDQGGGTLGTYYAIYSYSTWSRQEKQIWYVESTDNGMTWGAPQKRFNPDGSPVTVDGLPNTGNFALPEVTALGGGQYRSYFNTFDACNNRVTVTAASVGQQAGLTVAKAFDPTVVEVGATSQLTVTLTAPPATCSPAPTTPVYTGIRYTDTLPGGMKLAASPTVSNSCGGTLNAVANANTFDLSGVSLAAGASCTTVVNVSVDRAGVFRNVVSADLSLAGSVRTQEGIGALADAVATLRTPTPATAVPTLGEYALCLLSLALAAFGFRRARRSTR